MHIRQTMLKCILVSVMLNNLVLRPAAGIEPISGFSAGLAAVVSALLSNYKGLKSYLYESCDDRWVVKNTSGILPALEQKLHGQHLVTRAVVNHIKGHVKAKEPAKALALSFHGWTGTGKNFVSKIIAEHLFKLGMNSQYAHLISATKEFPHEGLLPFYKDQLRTWIEGNVTKCDRSLFIFDEMDKMPEGLIDTIKPYLDYYDNIGGVEYRRATFIFLSNAAGNDITKFVYEHWKSGAPREDIKLADVEKIIMKSALNTNGGLWHSELITKHLITAFIPFLPLTKTHIEECIKDSLISKGFYACKKDIENKLVKEIIDELLFYPETEQLFSATGCKRVAEKVDYIKVDD